MNETQICFSTTADSAASYVMPGITLVALVASEILPFISTTKFNGILHAIVEIVSSLQPKRQPASQ